MIDVDVVSTYSIVSSKNTVVRSTNKITRKNGPRAQERALIERRYDTTRHAIDWSQ